MRYRCDPAYPSYSWRAAAPPRPDLRASDAERNQVADRLSRHFADGRLDQAEFKARVDRAMGAVTRGDLEGLLDDLPRLPDEPRPLGPRRRLFFPVAVFLVLAALAVGSTVSTVHVSWILVVLAGAYLWHRARRRRVGSHPPSELHR